MMRGKTPLNLNPPQEKDASGTLKLYQSFHQRYYLVTGSLVCRQLGLPDHTVVRKDGEKTSFVLRRMVNGQEQGWVNNGPNKGWQPLLDEKHRRVTLRQDEERLPLHFVQASPAQKSNTAYEPRTVYYGYIPVGKREKYLNAATNVTTAIEQAVIDGRVGDPRLDDASTRVLEVWRGLYVDDKGKPASLEQRRGDNQVGQISLYLILDLGDFLSDNLPSVFEAVSDNGKHLADNSSRQNLFNKLKDIKKVKTSADDVSLADAINELKAYLPLVHGEGSEPASVYNVYDATSTYDASDPLLSGGAGDFRNPNDLDQVYAPQGNTYMVPVYATYRKPANSKDSTNDINAHFLAPGGRFYTLLQAALEEEKQERMKADKPWLKVPDEVADIMKNDPVDGERYFLRLVYEHAPCAPVVSEASEPFTFARYFDPEAPVRHIRIEMPSVDMKDLRKYKRGIGIQMSPKLSALLSRVHTGMLKGEGLLGEVAMPDLAVICSFSIPIITLLALIIMFLFLLLFNIIFQWLPFVKICFPLPKPK